MTKQSLYLVIVYIYRQNSIYKWIHQRSTVLVLIKSVSLIYGTHQTKKTTAS